MESFVDVTVMLKPGVYALVKKGVVIYVGKAKQLYSRIYTHRNVASRASKGQKIPTWMPVKGFVFDEVWVRPCKVEDLERLETEMINLYKPRFNESLKTHGPIKLPPLTINGVAINRSPAAVVRRV